MEQSVTGSIFKISEKYFKQFFHAFHFFLHIFQCFVFFLLETDGKQKKYACLGAGHSILYKMMFVLTI